ncbi:uncharacterized protein LOC131317065 [Rhododendron vialii]|uniref:uncharacterized protein LOC131317065 n=1 Tax=Rhododendron vialii TaxID=182163 RepID=UPI00265FAA5E|nr:uncharacterized protein LOC131317065 [Rhododendron vialii]
MNPLKCAFGVSAGNFLGFLVHQRGIEVDKNKSKALMEAKPPSTKKELQQLFGSLNYLRRFISNLAGRVKAFSPLLKIKDREDFVWEACHQEAFEAIKGYLARTPVLMPPIKNRPLKLYISAAEDSVGSLLAQDNEQGMEQAVYYLSRLLTPCEKRYSPIEKLCLALYFSAIKLRHYMLPVSVYIMSKTDLIKYLLTRPILRGRIGKWSLALMEFSFCYVPQKAVKGQALADFLVDHPCLEVNNEIGLGLDAIECTNNQAEYEAVVIGLEILRELGAGTIEVIGVSSLVINHLAGTFKCYSEELAPYYMAAMQLVQDFDDVTVRHVPRRMNEEANSLAQASTGLKLSPGTLFRAVTVQKKLLPSIRRRGLGLPAFIVEPLGPTIEDMQREDELQQSGWRDPIISFLKNPCTKVTKKTRRRAISYLLIGDDLYKKSLEDDLLLKCLDRVETLRVMGEVHEGVCGAHQSGVKMRWLIRRYGYYWPRIHEDCIRYAKGCQACQAHGQV